MFHQIVEEAPLVSCDDLTGMIFRIEVPTFLIGTENGHRRRRPLSADCGGFPDAEAMQLAGAGRPITHTADVGDTISGF